MCSLLNVFADRAAFILSMCILDLDAILLLNLALHS